MLKNIGNLLNKINHIIESGGKDIQFVEMIESYINENYSTDWKVGDVITDGVVPRVIEAISACALLKVNDSLSEYESIETLKILGYSKLDIPEITPETIALKFNVDVKAVKLLLKKMYEQPLQ